MLLYYEENLLSTKTEEYEIEQLLGFIMAQKHSIESGLSDLGKGVTCSDLRASAPTWDGDICTHWR